MSRRAGSALPVWFWFIPAFLIALTAVLLWQRARLTRLAALRRPVLTIPVRRGVRYVEPDSIPIDLRPAPEPARPPAAPAAAAAPAGPQAAQPQTEPDDLKVIEGIGPAISRLLADQGITTFRQLAETPVERLDEILRAANLRRLADPGTWPEQAYLAASGDWDGLKQLQSTLKGGRRSRS